VLVERERKRDGTVVGLSILVESFQFVSSNRFVKLLDLSSPL
jgi:hypothetical protein